MGRIVDDPMIPKEENYKMGDEEPLKAHTDKEFELCNLSIC